MATSYQAPPVTPIDGSNLLQAPNNKYAIDYVELVPHEFGTPAFLDDKLQISNCYDFVIRNVVTFVDTH